MKAVKSISFNYIDLHTLLLSLYTYWIEAAQNRKITREEFYRAYMVKKFYEKVRKRHDGMIESGKGKINVRFDIAHAVLMIDVLQRSPSSTVGNEVLSELGSMCPPQMLK